MLFFAAWGAAKRRSALSLSVCVCLYGWYCLSVGKEGLGNLGICGDSESTFKKGRFGFVCAALGLERKGWRCCWTELDWNEVVYYDDYNDGDDNDGLSNYIVDGKLTINHNV